MVDKVEAPDPTTVVFRLKFATSAFLPALADPFAWIYEKAILDKDPHWYEKNIMGSGPFKFGRLRDRPVDQGRAQSRLLSRRAALSRRLHRHLCAQAGGPRRRDPRRPRGRRVPRPAALGARSSSQQELGDKIVMQSSDWNCGNVITPNHKKKPFDDVRVRRALALAVDQWHGAPALAKIANVKTVGGVVFPGSPLAATRAELETLAGYWPDIEKSRAEAKRLLKEAGAEGLASSC